MTDDSTKMTDGIVRITDILDHKISIGEFEDVLTTIIDSKKLVTMSEKSEILKEYIDQYMSIDVPTYCNGKGLRMSHINGLLNEILTLINDKIRHLMKK